jgi:hypothetical protein
MRQSPLLVAALLAFALLAPPALAFSTDSESATKPDGSPRYADPDDTPTPMPLSGTRAKPSSQFSFGVTGSTDRPSSIPQSWQELDWANPLPDRRAR